MHNVKKFASFQKLEKIASVMNLSIDLESEEFGTFYVDSPDGYVFGCDGSLSCLAVHFGSAHNDQTWVKEAFDDLFDRLKHGLTKVTAPEELASWRYAKDDDNWGASDDAPDTIPFSKHL